MPDKEETPADEGNQQLISGDMLEQLFTVATEKAAKKEADAALKKGYVTREQINLALGELTGTLENGVVEKMAASLPDMIELAVKKALTVEDKNGQRRGTVLGSSPTLDDREADPVSYLIRKGKELGPESYDSVDKQILWAITYKALAGGMMEAQGEDE
jgi:hypothetical protein